MHLRASIVYCRFVKMSPKMFTDFSIDTILRKHNETLDIKRPCQSKFYRHSSGFRYIENVEQNIDKSDFDHTIHKKTFPSFFEDEILQQKNANNNLQNYGFPESLSVNYETLMKQFAKGKIVCHIPCNTKLYCNRK